MKKQFCEFCMEETSCTPKERIAHKNIDGINITFKEKYYICSKCNNDIEGDYFDDNVTAGNNELRKHYNIISTNEIEEILSKYNIGKKPLSLILGMGEINIIRYLDGANPTREISDILKNILNNPFLYELYLVANKDKISKVAYKKSLSKTKQIEFLDSNSKMYNVALYIINALKEVDPLSLQKILYFANGLSKQVINKALFEDEPMAWIYGPVYGEIYDCFSCFKGNKIDYNELLKNREFDLSEEEKEYLNVIIEDFGCYSGSLLREMSHLTTPWIHTREGLSEEEYSSRIMEKKEIDDYFKKVCKEYNIKSLKDISKYSGQLFEEARNKLF